MNGVQNGIKTVERGKKKNLKYSAYPVQVMKRKN